MAPSRRGLSGLTVSDMRKYPAILPLFAMLGAGVFLAAGASVRTLTKNPEVSLARRANPEPWNDYREKQYKFFGYGRDYHDVESPAPKYK